MFNVFIASLILCATRIPEETEILWNLAWEHWATAFEIASKNDKVCFNEKYRNATMLKF